MKNFYLIIIAIICIASSKVYAGGAPCPTNQNITSTPFSATGQTTCGAGDDFSSADACGSSYMNGDDWVYTYTPSANECVSISLSNTGSWVGLFVTDGCPSAGGTNCVASNTSSSGNPSISSVNLTGGTTYYITISTYPSPQCTPFDISITPCPLPPSNDDCSGATPVTVGSYNGGCVTTSSGTVAAATQSSQSTAACGGTEDDDVWFSFVAPSSGTVNIDLLNVSGSTTDLYHSVWSGSCPSLSLVAGTCSDPNSSTVSGLTPGQTYYVRVYTWTSTPGQTTTFDICIEDGACPGTPSNDDCSGATAVTVGAYGAGCTSTASGTVACATQSSQSTAACGGTEDDDVWFSFVAPSSGTVNIDLLNVSGSTTDLYHSVWSGTCPSLSLVAGTCSDPNSSTVSGLTPGQTYYVRVYTWTSTPGQTTTFDICIEDGQCPGAPSNDDCSGATPLTVNGLGVGCTSTASGTVDCASQSSQSTTACGGTEDDDVWFSFVAPASGSVSISLSNIVGSSTDMYHSVWSGTCPTLSLVTGTCSDPNSQQVTGLTPGQTYYIRVYTWTSTAGQNTTFDICVTELGPCGSNGSEDFCSDPATLTPGGNFMSSTSSIYTADQPANLGTVFCGSIENNSWYQFTATSTTETFNFTSVTNCLSGIQAEVYDVSTDAQGCCTNFVSMSNCWNPATATTGTVTATGLTVGLTYYLHIDGYGGDNCDFTVAGWSSSPLLPIKLLDFTGEAMSNYNLLKWSTLSETNNKEFVIERSLNGTFFETVDIIEGSGNSSNLLNYEYRDMSINKSTTYYYRLKQIDFDGKFSYSDVIVINRKDIQPIEIYPNPTYNELNVAYDFKKVKSLEVIIYDLFGKVVYNENLKSVNSGLNQFSIKNLPPGTYLINIKNQNGESLYRDKLIKY